MCVRKTAVKREVRLSGVRRGLARGGGEDKDWRRVWSMHMVYLDGNVCLKLITMHKDCTPVKCLLKFMVNLGLADLVLEKENSFLENAEYAL